MLLAINSRAQDALKQEVEERIIKEEMPEKALQLLSDWLEESKKIRFYYETDGDQQSYEAKLTRAGRRFSIEFDLSGELLDIEELVAFRQLPSAVQAAITSHLAQAYDRYKIRRIQRQFLPQTTSGALLDYLSSSPEAEYHMNYELEVDVKEESQMRSYELLFNSQGQLRQRRLIVRRSLDNFLY